MNFVRLDFRHENLHTRALPDDAATWRTWVLSGIVIKFGCDMPGGLWAGVMWEVGCVQDDVPNRLTPVIRAAQLPRLPAALANLHSSVLSTRITANCAIPSNQFCISANMQF